MVESVTELCLLTGFASIKGGLLMAFFEQIGKKISDAGQGVAQSSKNAMDISRLNSLISDKRKQIGQLYSALGESFFAAHREDPSPEFPQIVNAINSLFADIDKAENDIKQIRGVVKCPTCGADIMIGSAFCSACGTAAPVEAKAPAAPAGTRQCPQCGRQVPEENKFCTGCGYKF